MRMAWFRREDDHRIVLSSLAAGAIPHRTASGSGDTGSLYLLLLTRRKVQALARG